VNKKHFAWAALAIYSVLIFIGSSIPGDQIDLGTAGIDKLIHTIEYLVLSVLLSTALNLNIAIGRKSIFWVAVTGSSLYGLSDEIHQIFVPFRQFDLLDLACDASGSILGSYLIMRVSNNARAHLFKP
jgi:VanZ family protein